MPVQKRHSGVGVLTYRQYRQYRILVALTGGSSKLQIPCGSLRSALFSPAKRAVRSTECACPSIVFSWLERAPVEVHGYKSILLLKSLFVSELHDYMADQDRTCHSCTAKIWGHATELPLDPSTSRVTIPAFITWMMMEGFLDSNTPNTLSPSLIISLASHPLIGFVQLSLPTILDGGGYSQLILDQQI